MRGILGIVMMLISMHVFAGIANGGTFWIEVATSPMPQQGNNRGYAIKLIVE